ncbi:MAG: rhomboid family intramembrane serine protease [Desulfurococcales archaeon]|nr:rhomboid family intramembrane serine protease [Desulfurococcales archaeon]
MGIPVGDEESAPGLGAPIVNWALILVNVAVFIAIMFRPDILAPGAGSFEEVLSELGMVPAYVLGGERLYTVFTSMFLHASIAHLLGNMLFLYIFGDNIEQAMGRARYLAFYIISGLGAVVFHIVSLTFIPREALLNPSLSGLANPWLVPAVGASGAISGVMGAYILLFPTNRVRLFTWFLFPVIIELPAYVYLLFWFAFQLIMGYASTIAGASTGIAFWAHVGGFITGMALTPLFINKERLKRALLYQAYRYS